MWRPNLIRTDVLVLATSVLLTALPLAAQAADSSASLSIAPAMGADEGFTVDQVFNPSRPCRPRRCFEFPFPPFPPFPPFSSSDWSAAIG
jgi:hypothetical protein